MSVIGPAHCFRAILFSFVEPMAAGIMTVCVRDGMFNATNVVGFHLIFGILTIISCAQD